MKRIFVFVLTLALIALVLPLRGATLATVVPSAAQRGGRAVLIGSGLDDPGIVVAFTSADGRATARIVERAPDLVEVEVPTTAISGFVYVTNQDTPIASVPFEVTAPPAFLEVITLAGRAASPFKAPGGNFVYLPSGALYVADQMHHQIKYVLPNGSVALAAGTGKPGLTNGPAAKAQFKQPGAVAIDRHRGVLYVADTGNHVIRKITLDGDVTTFAGSGRPDDRDDRGTAAGFKQPAGLAIDEAGNLYVADTGNDKIRRITPDGTVSTVAGAGRPGLANGPAARALFSKPQGIAVDVRGVIFVADMGNHVVRRIENGVVTTIAGTGQPGYLDGTAVVAQFKQPSGLALEEDGSLVIADTKNNVIRRVIMNGSVTVTTIAGAIDEGFVDGAPTAARFSSPSGVSVAGAIFVSDTNNHAVRALVPLSRVAAVHPAFGSPAGGTTVRIFGSGFVPGQTQVKFGTSSAASVTFLSSTEVLAVTPSGTPGVVDVHVTGLNGTSTLPSSFTFALAPTFGSVTPAKGPVAGGQTVTITGSDFLPLLTAVSFGGAPSTDVAVISQSELTAVTPEHLAGSVDVDVTTPVGSSTEANAYRYLEAPAISGFSPAQATIGATVVITGEHFEPDHADNQVLFGNAPATVLAATENEIIASVPAGASSGPIRVTTAGGTVVTGVPFIVITYTHLEVTPASASVTVGNTASFTAKAFLSDGSNQDVTGSATWSTSDSSVAVVETAGVARGVAAGSASVSASFGGFTAAGVLTVTQPQVGPPDPATVATAIEPVVPTDFADSVRFLYEGATPVQFDTVPGSIDQERVTVVRGLVRARGGAALAGVRISVPRQPEIGWTLTREDGAFDLAVNGGGDVVVRMERDGFLPAERAAATRWSDYAWVPDVVLVQLDSDGTNVTMGAAAGQIARGSAVTDSDGTRRATVFIPPGMTATMVLPDGTSQSVSALTLRATEYTVGAEGRASMPAELPPTSGYTYCVELSADEAIAAKAGSVQFSVPLPFYLENFLDFPTGTSVPAGYYDLAQSTWVASDDGRVVRIVGVGSNIASLDIDGDDSADDASILGVTEEELRHLASLYTVGTSLWRVPVPHLTPWDYNFPPGPPLGATGPATPATTPAYWIPGSRKACGSIIDCENQTLGEDASVQGTPFALHYRSDRARGFKADKTVTVKLTGESLPDELLRIDLEITVQGVRTLRSFAPAPNLSYEFTWDGTDAYGRPVQGTRFANIRTGYVYRARYLEPAIDNPRSFALPSGSGTTLSTDRERLESTLWRSEIVRMSGWRNDVQSLGGWSLSPHHVLDRAGGVLFLGNGSRRSTDMQQPAIDRFAGNFDSDYSPDGQPARETPLGRLYGVDVATDGTVYFIDDGRGRQRIRKIGRDQVVHTVVGGGTVPCDQMDGAHALTVSLCRTTELAVGRDGSIYFVDNTNWIWKAGVDGIVRLVGGNGHSLDDGIPAGDARVEPTSLAIGIDGGLYLGDSVDDLARVRRIAPDGTIATIAGGERAWGYDEGDGGPARAAKFTAVNDLAIGRDGSMYVSTEYLVRRISPSGLVSTFAGSGDWSFPPDDGVPATASVFSEPGALAIGLDGSVYVTDAGLYTIRRVSSDGIINTTAGVPGEYGIDGDTGLAAAALLDQPHDIATGPDGSLYLESIGVVGLRRIAPDRGLRRGEVRVASEDGSTVYVFDHEGRHLRTINGLNGTPIYTFSYLGSLLSAITDSDGNVTTIERDDDGKPTAIIAPGGQRTTLVIGASGQLESISNPAAEKTTFTYANGLMTTMTTPRQKVYTFSYYADGRLKKDIDPVGGFTLLARTGEAADAMVERSSYMGRIWRHGLRLLTSGSVARQHTGPSGSVEGETERPNGSREVVQADGSVVVIGPSKPHAQYGSDAGFSEYVTLTTPSGREMTVYREQEAVLSDEDDPLSLQTLANRTSVNGRTFISSYDATTRVWTDRTPMSRAISRFLDGKGRLTRVEMPGVLAFTTSYDSLGRVDSTGQGARRLTFGYDDLNRLSTVTDALQRTVGFDYDAADRIIRQTLPDGREIGFGYDASGNLTSVTPPGRPAHRFSYTALDQTETYTPPGGGVTRYVYNKDRLLESIQRPDNRAVAFGYDTAGRLDTVTTDEGVFDFTFDAADRLSSVVSPAGEAIGYEYDGPLLTSVAWVGTVAGTLSFDYDADFRLAAETFGSETVGYSYDSDGLLMQAGHLGFSRDPENGSLTGTVLFDTADSWTYDAFGAVETYTATAAGNTVLSYSYTRDDLGRITQVQTSTTLVGYEYNAAGRLERVSSGATVVAEYDYDPNGNRTEHRYLGGSDAATYDDEDRLLTYGDVTYTYTANGDLESKTVAGVTTTFTYDVAGNLRRVNVPAGKAIEYVIDGQNRRVGKKVDGALVRGWLYSTQLRIVAEIDGSGTQISRFVYGSRANVPDYLIRDHSIYRIFSDHLGSPRIVVDALSGNIAQEIDYDEFGRVLRDTNPGFQPFGFAGGLYDSDTRLVRLGARDYDPHPGRWLHKDPLGFGSKRTNFYEYAASDPVNFVDFDGQRVYPADFVGPMQPGDTRAFSADVGDPRLAWLLDPFNQQAPEYYGESAECAALTKAFSGAPCTDCWREGPKVLGADIPPGTAIATFVDGRYPQEGTAMNSGIYIGQDAGGIYIVDQWTRHRAQKRLLRPKPPGAAREDDANAYSVISVPPGTRSSKCQCGR